MREVILQSQNVLNVFRLKYNPYLYSYRIKKAKLRMACKDETLKKNE